MACAQYSSSAAAPYAFPSAGAQVITQVLETLPQDAHEKLQFASHFR